MRYENLKLKNITDLFEEVACDIETTDELVNIAKSIREEKGLVDNDEVYYGFCMFCHLEEKEIYLTVYCEPECDSYELPMTDEEKLDVLFQVFFEIRKQEWEIELD